MYKPFFGPLDLIRRGGILISTGAQEDIVEPAQQRPADDPARYRSQPADERNDAQHRQSDDDAEVNSHRSQDGPRVVFQHGEGAPKATEYIQLVIAVVHRPGTV